MTALFDGILENLVVLEGGDGSGTSTQMGLLGERLARERPSLGFLPTAEPTGGPVGRLVRGALGNDPPLLPETLAALFAADRREHILAPGGIRDRCRRGDLVVCDRYVLSSLAYQGLECGDRLPRTLNEGFPAPDLLLFLDVDAETAMARMSARPSLEIFETLGFQRRVRDRFHSLLDEYRRAGFRAVTIDASRGPDEVARDVWRAVSELPIMNAET